MEDQRALGQDEPSEPSEPRMGVAIEAIERRFQEAYGRLRGARSTDVPLLIVVGHELVLRRGDQRDSFEILPVPFHEVKAASHLAVAAFLALWSSDPADSLRTLSEMSSRALGEVERRPRSDLQQSLSHILRITHVALDTAQAPSGDEAPEAQERAKKLAREVRAPLASLLEAAAALQLSAIHDGAERAFAKLGSAELKTVRVVVAGNHQARNRCLPVQYFERRLPERAGEEPRVVYGENVTTEEEALALLGTLRADRLLACTFFDDPARMDRDLLGDAAKRYLDTMNPTVLGRTESAESQTQKGS